MKQWATGTSQSALTVKATLAGLEQSGKRAFDQLAQGMGAGIAHAIVYSGSVSKAMRQALAATLESIAAESMVRAIYSTALGFLDLAEGNYDGAGKAFTAAAIFGSVGAAAAVAGRAVAGPQGQAGGAGGGGRDRRAVGALGRTRRRGKRTRARGSRAAGRRRRGRIRR